MSNIANAHNWSVPTTMQLDLVTGCQNPKAELEPQLVDCHLWIIYGHSKERAGLNLSLSWKDSTWIRFLMLAHVIAWILQGFTVAAEYHSEASQWQQSIAVRQRPLWDPLPSAPPSTVKATSVIQDLVLYSWVHKTYIPACLCSLLFLFRLWSCSFVQTLELAFGTSAFQQFKNHKAVFLVPFGMLFWNYIFKYFNKD